MRISEQLNDGKSVQQAFALWLVLVCSALLTVWFSQRSIQVYWQQTYHRDSPISLLNRFAWWRAGGEIQSRLNQSYQNIVVLLSQSEQPTLSQIPVEDTTIQSSFVTTPEEQLEVRSDADEASQSATVTPVSSPIIGARDLTETHVAPMTIVFRPRGAEAVVDKNLHDGNYAVLAPTDSAPVIVLRPKTEAMQHTNEHNFDTGDDTEASPHQAAKESITQVDEYLNVTDGAIENALLRTASDNTPSRAVTEQSQNHGHNQPSNINTVIAGHESSETEPQDVVVLRTGDRVLFVGDSLMQGIAPYAQKWLKSEYGIKSLNLSKQNTGLTYPKYFDWPATIEQTLQQDKSIRLLVMLLGPNDPWDIANPDKTGKRSLKFQSEEWEAVYRQRIERIVHAATAADVEIIWLGVPFMKKNKLDAQMRYLNQVLHRTLQGRAIWLPTDVLLSGQPDGYHDSIKIDGRTVRVRSKDGIHFTIRGQKYLADYIVNHIAFQDTQ